MLYSSVYGVLLCTVICVGDLHRLDFGLRSSVYGVLMCTAFFSVRHSSSVSGSINIRRIR